MHMIDFQYNGRTLSGLGYMPCQMVNNSTDGIGIGTELTFNTVKNNGNLRNYITSATYSDVLTATFDIVKNPCVYEDDMVISEQELRSIASWLQRRTYKPLRIGYDDGAFSNIFFNGSFTNITAISQLDGIVGLSLTFTADSPFGYGNEITRSGYSPFEIVNENDEYGCFYPSKFTIEVKVEGDVHVYNSADVESRCTEIKNCAENEIITLDCEHKLITSSIKHKKLYNDFNYVFPRLVKTDDINSESNIFTDDRGSVMTITYNPIRKVGILP